jgi:hypothetical protein
MESEVKIDIKETLEILKGLEVLGSAAKKIMSDGKVAMDDIVHLVEVAKSFDVLKDAVDDVSLSLKELKDLDETEAVQLIAAVFSLVKALKA